MASYPGSVKSFTQKNSGDVVQAAHVNDIQDEVNALEDGLLSGTARLNSSNSTIARLSVTGGSTFAVRPVMPPPEMALVYLESTGALASSVTSTLAWTAQSLVTDAAMHSTGSNPQRLTPQTTGVYQFIAQVGFAKGSPSDDVGTLALIDSSATFAQNTRPLSTGIGNFAYVIGYKRFDVIGGFVTVAAGHLGTVGSTQSLSTGIGASWFSMVKL